MTMPAQTCALSRVEAAVMGRAGIESTDSRDRPPRCQGPSASEPWRNVHFSSPIGTGFEFCLRQRPFSVILRSPKRTERRMAGTVRATYRSPSPVAGYAVAFVASGAALLLRWLLDPILGDRLPLATCYGAVAVAVWFGGYGPALVSTARGYAGAYGLFMAPRCDVSLAPADTVGLVLYAASALAITVLGEGMRTAQRRLEEHLAAAQDEQERLRREIAERERVERTLEESEAMLSAKVEEL